MRAWVAVVVFLAVPVFAAEAPPPEPKVRYRAAKEINFDSLELHGGIMRPELAVVTGNVSDEDNGLLRLRENFLDKLATDSAEDIQ